MLEMQRGFRCKLDEHLNLSKEIDIAVSVSGNAEYDSCCFGVNASEKLYSNDYMVFYNQTASPNQEIVMKGSGDSTSYKVNLSKLPAQISKLVFTVSIDGEGVMGAIHSLTVAVSGVGESLSLKLKGSSFQGEKAIIAIEIYKKDVWRISAVANGFNGGLSTLLEHFGGEESNEPIKEEPPRQEPPRQEPPSPPAEQTADPSLRQTVIKKGERKSLKNAEELIVEAGWKTIGKHYSLKALVRYRDGKLDYIGNSECIETLATKDGVVKYSDNAKEHKPENIIILWHQNVASIAICLYSALENGFKPFAQDGIFIRIESSQEEILSQSLEKGQKTCFTLCSTEIIFGNSHGEFEVKNLELYSKFGSENRIGYNSDAEVVMDIGPV